MAFGWGFRQVGTDGPAGRWMGYRGLMGRLSVLEWPVVRQFRSGDLLGRGPAVTSAHTRAITARTSTADRVVQSVCPYCAVGCGQRVFVKDEKVVQIEGDPDSPISRGRLCPKGSASEQLVNSPGRQTTMLYRAPARHRLAARSARRRPPTWSPTGSSSPGAALAGHDEQGRPLRRTMGIAALGGATLDNEENYLIKKLFTAAGAIQIENQARI